MERMSLPSPANLAAPEDGRYRGQNSPDFEARVEADIDPDFADVEEAMQGRKGII